MDLGSSHREQAVTGHCQKFSFFTADHAQVWIQGQAIENKQLQGNAKSFLFFTADHTQVWTQGQAIENKQW